MATNFRNKLKAKIKTTKANKRIGAEVSYNLGKYIRASINPRFLIQAPRGFLLISADYASQE